ncbi:MAG: B12-binding domain-containing radical SAM protein, partial [Deltaproteobacteria bacterium]|nr:B12-binding domain-containing radical SAM protein [Deltaproteobacteria bacterium]
LDENFLLHKKRALQLLELIEQHRKSWSFYVFSSARVLKSYAIEQLVSFGISWVWMGVEGQKSRYDKLNGVDTRALVRELHAHGICVLGSTIIGLEDHTTEGIDPVIDYAVGHETDFHQFMLYTPVPGTPLYAQYHREGKLLSETEVPLADAHGQYRFNYRHDHIPAGTETDLLQKAFCRDFEVNGPSLSRMFRSRLQGWQRYKAHPDQRVRSRYAWECASLKGALAGALWAMRRWYRQDAARHRKLSATLREIYHEFGWKTRVV